MILFGVEVHEAEAVVQIWIFGNRWEDFSTIKDEHDVLAAENIVRDPQYRIVKISPSRQAYDIYYEGQWWHERPIAASVKGIEDIDTSLLSEPPGKSPGMAYSVGIMQTLRQKRGLEPNDTSQDAAINDMGHHEAFRNVLEWEGIIGFDYKIRDWVKEIYGIELGVWRER